ncbi:MAG: hypothetical protein Q8Q88_18245 [Phenylobacterium sp.]|uniref:hypothetical protein n=1 Tax=Phenylobacterium sp. TaxID=1871053 RepID=UPI002736129F|nr:hypothetical protein [Phenylobacterium sp.]MDP3748984.1 hypothetical protein [Phenylobacterium sp.]
MPAPESTAPARLDELSQGEHMLLWAFRALAIGARDCRLIHRQFDEACGPAGVEALAALGVFVRELALNGRRKITLAAPGSMRITRDEQLILALFAAAQAEDYARLEAHLAWLLAGEPRPPFAAAACLTAQALGMSGYVLRLPEVEAPATIERPTRLRPLPARGERIG